MIRRVLLGLLFFGLAACGDHQITLPDDFCLFVCGDDSTVLTHRFIVSGTVNTGGAPAAARLELIAAAGGAVLSTTSSSAQDGGYDGLYGPGRGNICSVLEVRATLDVSGQQMVKALSDKTGVCRPGTTEGRTRHVVDIDFPGGLWIELGTSTDEIRTGETAQLTATVRDQRGDPIAGRTVSWASSDESVATVSPSGLVTGERTGVVEITAASEGIAESLTVVVFGAVQAYVTQDKTVWMIDVATNRVIGGPIPVGDGAQGIAITPDGTRAYVVNTGSEDVSVIDLATRTVLGTPIPVGDIPVRIAITPDGSRAYVTNFGSNDVSVIDLATHTVVGSPIAVGTNPYGVAVTPDGTRAYVANSSSDNVSVIDLSTNTVIGAPIAVGDQPIGVAITPDGSRVFVTNTFHANVTVIDVATGLSLTPISVGTFPSTLAITPDGSRVFAANNGSESVSVIDVAAHARIASVPVGSVSFGVAITPDGSRAYVTLGTGEVRVIDVATNTAVGQPIPIGIAGGVFVDQVAITTVP